MEIKYDNKYFINPAIEDGINNYLTYQESGKYNAAHAFEMYVIKTLCIIYGEKSITLPKTIDNEEAFKANLLIYELKEKDMEKFIELMGDYNKYLMSFTNKSEPTTLIRQIETILIEMINLRNMKKPFTDEELQVFESIFNPTDKNLKSIKKLFMAPDEDGLIKSVWNRDRDLTYTSIRILKENPELKDPSLYELYGYNLKAVAVMPPERIAEINKGIDEDQKRIKDSEVKLLPNQQPKKLLLTNSKNLMLTSGNGFVDTLMLLSIMMTEIMIGLIIAGL